MTDRHRRVAGRRARELAADPRVAAVLVHGSVAHGVHRPDSDLDLFVVTNGPADAGHSVERVGGIEVETITRSPEAWHERFARPRPTWVWSWSGAEVLFDRDGTGRSLVAAARERMRTHTTDPDHLRALAAFWRHVRPKLAAAVEGGDPVRIGWASSLSLPTLIESLFAVDDVVEPPPAHPEAFARLRSLPLPMPPSDGSPDAISAVFGDGDAVFRARAQLRLVDALLPLLERTGRRAGAEYAPPEPDSNPNASPDGNRR